MGDIFLLTFPFIERRYRRVPHETRVWPPVSCTDTLVPVRDESADYEDPGDNGVMRPEVIAERAYYLKENRTSPVILLQLARPDQPENDYPRCRLRMLIDARVEETEISGVDSIDCVAMALIMAGTRIAGLN